MPRRETRRQREARLDREAKALADRQRVWDVALSDGRRARVTAEVRSAAPCYGMKRDITLTVVSNDKNEHDEEKEESRSWEVPLYHGCSQWPVCGEPNRHCWTEGAHSLELALDGSAMHVWTGAMVLFKDGRDVDTGRTVREHWRREFLKKLAVGFGLIAIGGAAVGAMLATSLFFISMILLLVPFGVFYLILGIVGLVRISLNSIQEANPGQEYSETAALLSGLHGVQEPV